MPVHVGEFTSEVAVTEGELPLTEAQLEKLVSIVLARLQRHKRNEQAIREATTLRPQSAPTS
jgi:hypothetical protein